MTLLGLCGKAVAEDYLMPQWGHETKTVAAGETITFYDNAGTGSFASSTFYSQSTVVFKPAVEGSAIKVTFQELELHNYNYSATSSWKCYLNVYKGTFDKSSMTYPTSGSSVNEFPTNDNLIASHKGEEVVSSMPTYVSEAADGALSFCFYAKDPSSTASPGWKATVEVITLESMTITGAAGDNSFVDGEVWAGKTNVAVAGFGITTEGYSSPDKLQSLTFTCSNSAVINPTALKLYAGKAASTSALTEIAGTITESNGVYTYTLTTPQALGNGTNKFCVGADILASAAFNATTAVNVTGIATVGNFTTFTPAQAVTLTVQPMYLMTTDATYTVSQPTNFFDEGGKDGKVIKGFDGKVVFEPATDGKKVALTFKDIEVFYTEYAANSTGYVDYIKVYNGNSTAAADLLWEITEAQATCHQDILIRSTAADGKLTVTHKCNISYDSNLKAGWQAVVDEFTPQAMTLSELTYAKQSGKTAAGKQNVLLGSFTLTTANTEPALSVASLELTTNNTFAQMSKLKLYYTKDNTFATTNLLGEVAVSANAVTLSATNTIALREGENHLWLVADVSSMAENGQRLEFVPAKLTFTNNTEYTTFAAQEGALTIENVAIQACGSQTFNIQGEWQYTHTVASEYSSKYMYENCDQTVIFKPMHSGNVIQIDYTDFDVYYATSSYSTRAKYIVYAGEGTSGDKLWELDANGKKPEQIRSTAADGVLTIVFNPNTTSSYYTGNGWHAAVKEYELKNMALDKVTVEQASTKIVQLGEAKAALLNVNVATEGSLQPLSMSAVAINLKGSEANLSKIYLLHGETVLAEATVAATVTLTLTTPAELAEYDNPFVIAADIKDDAVVDATIDAALTAVTIGTNVTTVTNGDPEGNRTVKNVMNLSAGDNGTKTIGESSLMFYDDGGADEKYTSKIEGYVTFVPATEGYAVELVVNNYSMSYNAPVKIYSGREHSGDPMATVEYNYSNPEKYKGASFISAAADGSLTVYFKDDGYSANDGWEFEIRQHLLTPLTMDSVVVTKLAPTEATKGTSDIRLMQAALYVSGDNTPITVTGFEQTASDLLVDRHIYATGQSTTFSTGTEVTGDYVINERGVYYFWFVGSISTDAWEGDLVSLQLKNIVYGANKLAPAGNATATINVVSGAHGYYQIGASATADYATLSQALQSIAAIGMDGAVTLAIENGTYTEQVTVPEITGAGASNTLTIRSVSGDYNDVTYQYNSNLVTAKGVFTIEGADYVTVQGISFTSSCTNNQGATVVVVNNASTHVTFDNCHIYANRYTETTSRLDLLRVDAGENLFNNDFTLTNSVFDGGYIGLTVSGHKAAADALQQNMLIEGNTFRNQGKQQVYGDAVAKLKIIGNTFRQEVKSSTSYAIDWLLVGDTAMIAGNDVLITATAADNQSAAAFYIRPNSYQDKENAVICMVNNVLNVQNASTYVAYGINFNSNLPQLLLAHNTVVTNAEGTASSPFYFNAAPAAGSRFVNNIFQAQSKGYAVRYKNATVATNVTYEHNIFFTPQTDFGMPTATFGTFAGWKTAIGATDEQGNLNEAVVFASANLLLPKQTNDGHLLTAAVMAEVTRDLLGKQRSATPTIGAYEYDPELMRMPALAEGYPLVQNIRDTEASIAVKADNMGSAKILVLAADATAPTVDEVLAQGTELTLQKDAEAVLTVKNLTEETAYKAYVVMLSPIGDAAETVVATEAFTTLWTLRPVALQPIAAQTVAEDAEFTLTATLVTEYEQAKPYTYKWYTAFETTAIGTAATYTGSAARSTEYICQVTDKFGQSALVSAHVQVTKAAAMATFEEYVLAPGEHKMVDDAWADNTETWLYSGTYAFANTPNKNYGAFSGYVISADASTEYVGNHAVDQYRSAAGGAYEGQNFAVAYYSAPSSWFAGYTCPITFTNSDEPQTITGFYITNSVYTLDAILNGDYANPVFSEGDYLSLTVKGYNGSTPTGQVVFYLADYRSENAAEHFALTTWKWLDLSSLGAVTRIEFEMFTTKSDAYGFTTPTYFCLDNFGASAPSPATGVGANVLEQQAVKRIENGVLYITLPDGSRFDAQGKRVE